MYKSLTLKQQIYTGLTTIGLTTITPDNYKCQP